MNRGQKEILEMFEFIRDRMVTKDDFNDAVDNLRGEFHQAHETMISRLGGIENRLDSEAFSRADLERRIRKGLPGLASH